jgi:hypothetical protein
MVRSVNNTFRLCTTHLGLFGSFKFPSFISLLLFTCRNVFKLLNIFREGMYDYKKSKSLKILNIFVKVYQRSYIILTLVSSDY